MSSNFSSKKASLGNIAQFSGLADDPREAANRIDTPSKQEPGAEAALAAVAESQNDEMDPMVDGQPLSYEMSPRTDSRGKAYKRGGDYDWTRNAEVGPNRRFGETLAAQEQRLGEEAEMDRYQTRGRREHEADNPRAQASRVAVDRMDRWYKTQGDPWEGGQAVPATEAQYGRRGEEAEGHVLKHEPVPESDVDVETGEKGDPRAGMEAEMLAKVNKSAQKLADHFGPEISMGRPELSRLLARLVERGSHLTEAVTGTKKHLESIPGVKQAVEDISRFQRQATVEGEVVTLFKHPSKAQYQAGWVEDETGEEIKVTYWNKSKKANAMPTLAVGDQVRIEEGMISNYRSQATMAITGDTEITVLESGDGPKHTTGTQRTEPTIAPWDPDSDQHSWANPSEGHPGAGDMIWKGLHIGTAEATQQSKYLGSEGETVTCPVEGCKKCGTVREVRSHMGGKAAGGDEDHASASLED